jgi:Domain of unknown function (DUF4249)
MKKSIALFATLIIIGSCVDRISIQIPNETSVLVVDGLITDEPGPYTVQLTRAANLDSDLTFRKFVTAKSVTILDDLGNSELLKEVELGIYKTNVNGIRGVVGRAYHVRIETRDGKIFESVPEKIKPVGKIDSVYYEFGVRQPFNEQAVGGFNVFVDSKGLPESDNLLRWAFAATFQVETFPELHRVLIKEERVPDPLPCSSYRAFNGTILQIPGKPCDCCTCWVTEYEDKPHASDNQFVTNGNFRRIQLGFIPIDPFHFHFQVMVQVRQMSLSRTAFNFWRNIQSQKEGAGSLFQPPSGKARTNIFEITGAEQAQGIFYAAGVDKKIDFKKFRFEFPPTADSTTCLRYKNSTNLKPPDWVD